ncbi:MAG: glycoside hydrolase family 13 protein [Acidimicrobiales bacterium]
MADPSGPLLASPHHSPSAYMVSNPTPASGETVEVSVVVPDQSGVGPVMLRTVHDGEATFVEGRSRRVGASSVWTFDLGCHNEIVNYRFWCGGSEPHWLTGEGLVGHDPTDRSDFKLATTGATPKWVPETVWYQIFPDRFASADPNKPLPEWARHSDWDAPIARGRAAMSQVYGGDLDGISGHLDHLIDLGVGGIYLTPVFEARSNHRYDASSFDRVDPLLGGDEALVRLAQACHRAGIRVISDLTLNHTGSSHEWFQAAQADLGSPEAGFYFFGDEPDDYEAWLGVASLPKLDHSSGELRRRLYEGPRSAFGKFLGAPFELDGWRIDVANMTGRLGLSDLNRQVRSAARATLDQIDPDKWLVGEHFFDYSLDATGPGWHGCMNYGGVARPILSWLGSEPARRTFMPGPGVDARAGGSVAASIDAVMSSVPWQFVLGSMALIGSHDTSRWHSMAASPELARIGVALTMTLPGSPCIFYGDEIGLTGVGNHESRRTMPWNRDSWDRAELDWYRSLIALRGSSQALAHGGLRWAERADDALAFIRESAEERMLVRACRAGAPALRLSEQLLGTNQAELVFGDGTVSRVDGNLEFDLEGPGVAIWRIGPQALTQL